MAAFAASRMMLMRNRGGQSKVTEQENQDSQAVRKISQLTAGVSLGDRKFHQAHRTGLSDGTSAANIQSVTGGYINKIRRDSASGKPREPKKVPLVRQNSKISFKPAGKKVHFSEKKQFTVPVPAHAVPADHAFSPMEDHSPMVMIHKHMIRKPKSVEDIDAVADPLKCSMYAQDIIDYLQSVERRFSFPARFLQDKKCQVTPRMRTVLFDWLIQVQVHQNLSQETLHMCAALTDRILATQSIQVSTLQLLGIASLLIAAKYHERFAPEICDLCHLTDGTYNTDQVLKMERYILRALDFDLSLPGPVVFLDRFLLVNPCDKNTLIKNMSMFLLDLALTELSYVHIFPSMLAASAICVSRELFGFEELWNASFIHYTKYSENDLLPAIRILRKSLSKLSKSEFTGAKMKYVHHTFDGISRHRAVLMAKELWPEYHDEVFDEVKSLETAV